MEWFFYIESTRKVNTIKTNQRKSTTIFIQDYEFENVICKIMAILSQPQDIQTINGIM